MICPNRAHFPLDFLLRFSFRSLVPEIARDEVQLLEKLGSGASGDVFAGVYQGRDVAVKVRIRRVRRFDRELLSGSVIPDLHVYYMSPMRSTAVVCVRDISKK